MRKMIYCWGVTQRAVTASRLRSTGYTRVHLHLCRLSDTLRCHVFHCTKQNKLDYASNIEADDNACVHECVGAVRAEQRYEDSGEGGVVVGGERRENTAEYVQRH